jgi:hypothetical protein
MYYSGNCMGGLWKTIKILNQDSRWASRDLCLTEARNTYRVLRGIIFESYRLWFWDGDYTTFRNGARDYVFLRITTDVRYDHFFRTLLNAGWSRCIALYLCSGSFWFEFPPWQQLSLLRFFAVSSASSDKFLNEPKLSHDRFLPSLFQFIFNQLS